MSNQGRISALSAAIMAASLTMTGCIDSSSSDSESSSESSRFQFTVTTPSDSSLAKSFIERSVESMVDFIIPKAHAALTEQNIQIAIVDASGKVLSIVTPKEAPVQEEDGSYSIVLEGGERLDCVILISLDGPNTVQVGETIDSEKYLFTPAVESEDIFDIDLTSTVAFGLFLDEVESFENLTPSEVDRLIDGAQELVEETGITADSAEALEAALEEGLSSFIKTETALATLSDETATEETPSTGSIETDREKIKGFFDDVNTLAALSNSFSSAEDDGLLDDLVGKAELSQQVLEGSEQTLADFAELQSTLQLELADYDGVLGKDISEIFANDEKAQLTGLLGTVVTEDGVITSTFRINGSYGVLSSVNLEFIIEVLNDTTPVKISLNGLLVSPEASIEIAEGLIEVNTGEAIPIDAINNDTLTDEQAAALAAMSVSLKSALMISLSVNQADETLSHFSGQVAFEVIRSTNDYIEFAGEEAQPYFNTKNIELEGRFSLGDDFVSAKVSAIQNNAETFVPMTQQHVDGEESTELLSYDYNGTDSFTLNTPDYSYTDTADANYAYEVLFISNAYNNYSRTFNVNSDGFDSYVNGQNFTLNSQYGDYSFQGSSLVKGTQHGTVTANKNNSSTDAPESLAVNYSYSEGTLSYSMTYEADWGALRGETFELLSSEEGVLSIKTTDFWADPYFGTSSVEEYVASRDFDFYIEEDGRYAYYSINGEDLSLGTNQNVTGTLYYANYESAQDTYVSQYDLTDEYLEFNGQNSDPRKILFVKSEEYVGLNVTRNISSSFDLGFGSNQESPYLSYGSTKDTFQEYLERYSVSNEHIRLDSIGGVYVSPYELTIGTDTALTTTINYVNSLENYENENTYSNLSISAEFEVQLEALGNTKISTQIERTGFDDGVIILSIENTDSASLNSEITLMATVNDNQLGSLSIANGDGFVISKDALVDSGEAIELTYGLETATVEAVGTGIKVTYSNGEFDLY
ncbi:MAG: hypothetical protein V7785_18075 [Bermanella sp.]